MYSREELIEQFEETYENLQSVVNELQHLVRNIPDETLKERARRMMLAHLEMAMNNDHMWLGGNMYTLADLIEDLRDPGNWDEEEVEETIEEVPAAPMEESAEEETEEEPVEEACETPTGETYLVISNNLLANIGCKEVAEAFAQFLNDKGLATNVHPVGLAIARDAMSVRTEEIARHVQMYMQEFAESEYNPMRQ